VLGIATGGPTGTRPVSTPTPRTHVRPRDIEPTQIAGVGPPISGIVSDAARRWPCRESRGAERAARATTARGSTVRQRKQTMLRPHPLRRRPGQAAARLRGDEPLLRPDTRYVSTSGCPDRRRPVPARVPAPALINAGSGRGLDAPAALGAAWPTGRAGVSLPGLRFSFMIEEMAVGAAFPPALTSRRRDNSYLGLILSPSAGSTWTSASAVVRHTSTLPSWGTYGVDHVKVAMGWGAKGIPRRPARGPGARVR